MRLIDKHGPYVKDQILMQEKLAAKFRDQEWRAARHLQNAAQARVLLDDLATADAYIKNASSTTVLTAQQISPGITVSPEDLDGLPQELLDQLVLSEADSLEFEIVSLMRNAGGALPINKIMIGLYRKTGTVQQRPALISRLHRMVAKKRIYAAQDRSGIFSISPLNDDELKGLQGDATSEEQTRPSSFGAEARVIQPDSTVERFNKALSTLFVQPDEPPPASTQSVMRRSRRVLKLD